MAFGVLVAVFPHLLEFIRNGTWNYIADPDERWSYLPLIGHAYANHPWTLGDPALRSGGVCLYPWIQFAPWILMAKLFHGGPLAVLLLWRIWSGLSLGLIVYLLGRELLGGSLPALWLALVAVTRGEADKS